MTLKFKRINERGIEKEHEIPAKFEVCEKCQGHGTHLTPSIGNHAYSVEEFNESFDDEEREEYFKRGGRYDVTCIVCNGEKVVKMVDLDECEKTLRGRRLLTIWNAVDAARFQEDYERMLEDKYGW